jgi:hypothetical protein
MIDKELVEGLRALLPECTRDESDALLAAVKARFQIDHTATWWWTAIGVGAEIIAYDGADPTPRLRALLGNEGTKAFLIATDDGAPPWPVFRGGWLELVRAVLEQRYFAYALVAEDLSWIVFDTHHNQLVIAGLGNNPRQ